MVLPVVRDHRTLDLHVQLYRRHGEQKGENAVTLPFRIAPTKAALKVSFG